MVCDQDMKTIIMENSLEDAAKKLIDLANINGGKDNITVVLFKPLEGVPDAQ
jgi:protein phosphatase